MFFLFFFPFMYHTYVYLFLCCRLILVISFRYTHARFCFSILPDHLNSIYVRYNHFTISDEYNVPHPGFWHFYASVTKMHSTSWCSFVHLLQVFFDTGSRSSTCLQWDHNDRPLADMTYDAARSHASRRRDIISIRRRLYERQHRTWCCRRAFRSFR